MQHFKTAVLALAGLLCTMPTVAAVAATPTSAAIARLANGANQFWARLFTSLGGRYRRPTVLDFDARIAGDTCDQTMALTGAFYCPRDQVIYLDQAFLAGLAADPASTADAERAFVVGHEIAHHVQFLMGTTQLVNEARSRSAPALAELTLTSLELQADCYTGLWLKSAGRLRLVAVPGNPTVILDRLAGLSAAWQTAQGKDVLMPDPLDTGSMEQRHRWFLRGYNSGRYTECDTFRAQATGTL
jgi:predicted metalloprotease